MSVHLPELDTFIAAWKETPEKNKQAFLRFKDHLVAKDGAQLEFVPREGLTYSLRASFPYQTERPLFVMVDVIEDDPRWLSVCFYGEMISDPEEAGDYVPEGLLGEDAVCFDIESYDAERIAYVTARIDEAWRAATGQ
ncbi:MAG: hypothetical protein V2L15_01850 [Desulfobacteraceae bacterium]|jgi:hypothetical protein|nr:hypothetical protein [Desulfobacteraceae bacterium]